MNAVRASASSIASSGMNGGRPSPAGPGIVRLTAMSICANGSQVETPQSEPITTVAPWRRNERSGYWRAAGLGAQEGQREHVHLVLVDRPQGLHVGERAELPEPRAGRPGG